MTIYFANRALMPGRWETTPEGFLRCKARVLANAVLEYYQNELDAPFPGPNAPDPLRLLVPHASLEEAEALRSLEGAAVVAGAHYDITPETARTYQKGQVAGAPRLDGDYLECDLLITDPGVIEDIRAGRLTEISAAYGAVLVGVPGLHQGQPYHAQQTEIRFNHIAVIPPGTGRAGRNCKILNMTKGERTMSKSFEEGRRKAEAEINAKLARLNTDLENGRPGHYANTAPRPRERSPLERLGFERPAQAPKRGQYQNAGEALAAAMAAVGVSRLSMRRAMDPLEAERHMRQQLENLRPLNQEVIRRRKHNRDVHLARLGFRPEQEAAPVRRSAPAGVYHRPLGPTWSGPEGEDE